MVRDGEWGWRVGGVGCSGSVTAQAGDYTSFNKLYKCIFVLYIIQQWGVVS